MKTNYRFFQSYFSYLEVFSIYRFSRPAHHNTEWIIPNTINLKE